MPDSVVTALVELLRRPDVFNLIPDVIILWLSIRVAINRPEPLKGHAFARDAHGFWLAQWAVILATDLFVAFSKDALPPPTAAGVHAILLTAQSFCALGFFFSYLHGDEFDLAGVAYGLFSGFLICAALSFTFVRLFYAGSIEAREVAILLTQTLATTALILLGGAFLMRYGASALSVVIITTLYTVWLAPLHAAMFVRLEPEPSGWLFLIAFWKFLIARYFYMFFLTPLQAYPRRSLQPLSSEIRAELANASQWRQVWVVFRWTLVGVFIGIKWLFSVIIADPAHLKDAEQRAKISKDLVRTLFWAIVMAIVVAYMAVDRWLQK